MATEPESVQDKQKLIRLGWINPDSLADDAAHEHGQRIHGPRFLAPDDDGGQRAVDAELIRWALPFMQQSILEAVREGQAGKRPISDADLIRWVLPFMQRSILEAVQSGFEMFLKAQQSRAGAEGTSPPVPPLGALTAAAFPVANPHLVCEAGYAASGEPGEPPMTTPAERPGASLFRPEASDAPAHASLSGNGTHVSAAETRVTAVAAEAAEAQPCEAVRQTGELLQVSLSTTPVEAEEPLLVAAGAGPLRPPAFDPLPALPLAPPRETPPIQLGPSHRPPAERAPSRSTPAPPPPVPAAQPLTGQAAAVADTLSQLAFGLRAAREQRADTLAPTTEVQAAPASTPRQPVWSPRASATEPPLQAPAHPAPQPMRPRWSPRSPQTLPPAPSVAPGVTPRAPLGDPPRAWTPRPAAAQPVQPPPSASPADEVPTVWEWPPAAEPQAAPTTGYGAPAQELATPEQDYDYSHEEQETREIPSAGVAPAWQTAPTVELPEPTVAPAPEAVLVSGPPAGPAEELPPARRIHLETRFPETRPTDFDSVYLGEGGTYEVLISPFAKFSQVGAFSRAVAAIPGVRRAQTRQFFKGTLHLKIVYDGEVPLANRLGELLAFQPRIASVNGNRIEVRVAPLEAQGGTSGRQVG